MSNETKNIFLNDPERELSHRPEGISFKISKATRLKKIFELKVNFESLVIITNPVALQTRLIYLKFFQRSLSTPKMKINNWVIHC